MLCEPTSEKSRVLSARILSWETVGVGRSQNPGSAVYGLPDTRRRQVASKQRAPSSTIAQPLTRITCLDTRLAGRMAFVSAKHYTSLEMGLSSTQCERLPMLERPSRNWKALAAIGTVAALAAVCATLATGGHATALFGRPMNRVQTRPASAQTNAAGAAAIAGAALLGQAPAFAADYNAPPAVVQQQSGTVQTASAPALKDEGPRIDDRMVVSGRMSYSRFLEYLDLDRVKEVRHMVPGLVHTKGRQGDVSRSVG